MRAKRISRPGTGHPRLTVTLIGIIAYGSGTAIWVDTTKAAVLAMTSPSAGELLGTVWGVTAFMAIATLIAIARPRTTRVRITLLAMMAVVLIVAGVGTVRVNGYASSGFLKQVSQSQTKELANENQMARDLADACQQNAVSGAAAMTSDRDIHPLLILDERGNIYGRDAIIQHGWMPSSLSQVKAVVCLGAQTSSTQTCSYDAGTSYQLTSYSRDVSIIGAATGQQLASSTLTGSDSTCASSISSNQMVSDESGNHVSTDDVINYILGTVKSLS